MNITKQLECASCSFHGITVTQGVEMESSRTMYHFEGVPGSEDDPNRPIPLCRACAADHHEHWNEMWAEYRAGLL